MKVEKSKCKPLDFIYIDINTINILNQHKEVNKRDGTKKTKSFSINKYGYDEALKLANEFRDIIDDRLNIVSESK